MREAPLSETTLLPEKPFGPAAIWAGESADCDCLLFLIVNLRGKSVSLGTTVPVLLAVDFWSSSSCASYTRLHSQVLTTHPRCTSKNPTVTQDRKGKDASRNDQIKPLSWVWDRKILR
jgi:hypothetical protein